jgi:glutaredoxin 3
MECHHLRNVECLICLHQAPGLATLDLSLVEQVMSLTPQACPSCRITKSIFENLGVELKVFELDEMGDGVDIQDALLKITGQRSVPNVFVIKELIGGNHDTQASFRYGALETKLGLSKWITLKLCIKR